MTLEEQKTKKIQRIALVVDSFLKYENISISELSKRINVPEATIKKDLKAFAYIQKIYGLDAKDVYMLINKKIKQDRLLKYEGKKHI